MSDKITNYYEKLPKDLKRENKPNKTFKNHHILPTSMIAVLGGTGSGKSNAITDFIHRSNGTWFQIIIFNPVSTDEPLLNMLKQKCPEIELITDINELPALSESEEDKDQQKLIIFDDIINMPKKDFKKINEYFTGGRKSGWSVICMAQNYTSLPKIVTRNCQYFIVFKLNDNTTINNIIRNHNINNINKEKFRNLYDDATSEPLSFFMIDLKGKEKGSGLRKGFLNFYD